MIFSYKDAIAARESLDNVLPFVPLRVQQIREELNQIDDRVLVEMTRAFVLEDELKRLGYGRD